METMNTTTRRHLTIGILTMNEERRIEACIRSALFADEIIVVDSGSKDNTVALAQKLGAKVYTHADWQGFAEQRNRLLRYCTGDYIFFLDADEVITPELQTEVQAAASSGQQATWEVLWNQVAYGRPLTLMKSTGGVQRMFPVANLERFEGVVHEQAIVRSSATPVIKFKGKLLHYSRETIYGSLQKLAQYAQLGAQKRVEKGKRGGVLRGFASALANFLQLYVFRRGFLCGAEGFLFCFFISLECFFRYAMLHYDRAYLNESVSR